GGLPGGNIQLVGVLPQHRHEDDGTLARVLQLIKPAKHAARMCPVDSAQIPATTIGESFGLLLGMGEAEATSGGPAVDGEGRKGGKRKEPRKLQHPVAVGPALNDGSRPWRIWATQWGS